MQQHSGSEHYTDIRTLCMHLRSVTHLIYKAYYVDVHEVCAVHTCIQGIYVDVCKVCAVHTCIQGIYVDVCKVCAVHTCIQGIYVDVCKVYTVYLKEYNGRCVLAGVLGCAET